MVQKEVAAVVKKDLFSANRRIARLEAFIRSLQLDGAADDMKREEILKEKW